MKTAMTLRLMTSTVSKAVTMKDNDDNNEELSHRMDVPDIEELPEDSEEAPNIDEDMPAINKDQTGIGMEEPSREVVLEDGIGGTDTIHGPQVREGAGLAVSRLDGEYAQSISLTTTLHPGTSTSTSGMAVIDP